MWTPDWPLHGTGADNPMQSSEPMHCGRVPGTSLSSHREADHA